MAQDGLLDRSRSSSSDNSSHSEFLPVLSSLPYQALREAFYKDGFGPTKESVWPVASLDKGSARGHALLMPPAAETFGGLPPQDREAFINMACRQAREMGDLDADVLDGLSAHWLRNKDSSGGATATVDDLLGMRGLKQKQKASGRHNGYLPQQRREMMRALARQQSLWLVMAQVETYEVPEGGKKPKKVRRSLQSRAFIITDRLGQELPDGSFHVEQFRFRPGDVFAAFLEGPGRQTALLSAKALKYDPYRQTWEKRLTRYLSWQWRVKQASGRLLASYRVQTLLDAIGVEMDPRRAAPTRERLESALDTLEADGVIAEWRYEGNGRQNSTRSRGWAREWLQTTVLIEPPSEIEEQYRDLERGARYHRMSETIAPSIPEPAPTSLGERVKQRRKQLGLSQLQLSEDLNINQGHLSKVECGIAPSEALRERIVRWLEKTNNKG